MIHEQFITSRLRDHRASATALAPCALFILTRSFLREHQLLAMMRSALKPAIALAVRSLAGNEW